MPDLDFKIEGIEVEPFAAVPTLVFAVRVINRAPATPVENVALRCQIRIDPTRRPYGEGDHARLRDLFGDKEGWGKTLHGFLWDHIDIPIPAFQDQCVVKAPLACSHDFNIAATKYFHGLTDGEIPLSFYFSGAIFYRSADGRLQIGQVSWNQEAWFRLPVATWQAMMARYHPDTTWLRIQHETFEQLDRYKQKNGFSTWEQALESLLRLETREFAS
ncbi:MAG: DUF6084 family protein [Caulobacteraceae bacterium]